MSISNARELRKHPTEAERLLWIHLRYRQMNGHKFRRQHPIGQYIVDFACLEKYLVIEIDGGQHAQQGEYDSIRSTWLESQGFRVLRFWNNQVLQEIDAVKAVILEELGCSSHLPATPDHPHSNSPPQGGENNFLPLDGEGWDGDEVLVHKP